MKKIKLSLAALTLVLAIAGTTTVNATKAKSELEPCSSIDPTNEICLNEWVTECCERDNMPIFDRTPKPR